MSSFIISIINTTLLLLALALTCCSLAKPDSSGGLQVSLMFVQLRCGTADLQDLQNLEHYDQTSLFLYCMPVRLQAFIKIKGKNWTLSLLWATNCITSACFRSVRLAIITGHSVGHFSNVKQIQY